MRSHTHKRSTQCGAHTHTLKSSPSPYSNLWLIIRETESIVPHCAVKVPYLHVTRQRTAPGAGKNCNPAKISANAHVQSQALYTCDRTVQSNSVQLQLAVLKRVAVILQVSF